MDNQIRNQCAERRTKNHKVVVIPAEYGDYENEACLKVTHNGFQWQHLCLSETEAKEVINQLSKFFKFGVRLTDDQADSII